MLLFFITSLTFRFEIVDSSKPDTKLHFITLNCIVYQNVLIPLYNKRINISLRQQFSRAPIAAFTLKHLNKATNHTQMPILTLNTGVKKLMSEYFIQSFLCNIKHILQETCKCKLCMCAKRNNTFQLEIVFQY